MECSKNLNTSVSYKFVYYTCEKAIMPRSGLSATGDTLVIICTDQGLIRYFPGIVSSQGKLYKQTVNM